MARILMAEPTPNPLAFKLRLDRPVTIGGGKQYTKKDDAWDNPVAQKLFDVHGVDSLFFMDDFITINKTPGGIWDFIFFQAHEILEAAGEIKPLELGETKKGGESLTGDFGLLTPTEKIAFIDRVIDETIRPGLARDGGDILITGLEGNLLKVKYQGACGNCPSAAGATLHYISNMLQSKVSADLQVIPG